MHVRVDLALVDEQVFGNGEVFSAAFIPASKQGGCGSARSVLPSSTPAPASARVHLACPGLNRRQKAAVDVILAARHLEGVLVVVDNAADCRYAVDAVAARQWLARLGG